MNIRPLKILLVLLFIAVTGCDSPHPSDDVLKRNFERHEADFERLARMCQEDSQMVRIADDFTWTKTSVAWPRPESELGISAERWNEYRTLFGKVGLDNGLVSYQPDLVLLFANNRGMVTGGSSKGYAYSVKPPAVIVDSLDTYRFEGSTRIAYLWIKGNWYLYSKVS